MEIVILAVLIAFLWRSKSRPTKADPTVMPEKLKESIERFITESDRIAEVFQDNLKDKRDLTSDLILKLDRRLKDYQELLRVTQEAVAIAQNKLEELGGEISKKIQTSESMANPAAPEVRAQVLQLAKKGLSVEDIAVRSKLHRGEVELIIDLEHQFDV
ncbi:MAG: hypothetical protein LBT62_08795 [Deltaproteobacteria bacterium]|nr:hypothetical protein [Deltaproteobacteria bacterium]